VILDTKGNIFGGFTPAEWESNLSDYANKGDPSLKSFLFTLKNPHNVPPRRFALKPEMKHQAILCSYFSGPYFYDFSVSNTCSTNTNSSTEYFGYRYTNDTGLGSDTFFTGSKQFQVKEIEVFEITE
jgi:hypothetical protein